MNLMKKSENTCKLTCTQKKHGGHMAVAIAATILLIFGCTTVPPSSYSSTVSTVSKEQPKLPAEATSKPANPVGINPAPGGPFPTFEDTGHDICYNDAGLPVIILFSLSTCPHCQWVGDTFDQIVKNYVDKGLIEAHHYDVLTKDDLLTPEVETSMPKQFLQIGRSGNPDGHLPYFNFGCKFDRIGNGYEAQNDLAAEAREMCQVIEALIHNHPKAPSASRPEM